MNTTAKLISFHGKQSIKDEYIKRLQIHYDADQIVKGQYWENGKGCAVGCTIHSGRHDSFEPELGITWRLALLEDSLFERMPNKDAKEFPLQFLKAMPVGVDTNLIFKKFILWNLIDEKEGLVYHIKGEKEISILKRVADLYQRSFTEEISNKEWKVLSDEASAYASASASASASAYASAYAYASASASASAYASAYAYAYAYAYASAYAYAYAYAYASAYAYAYAYASAYASTEWQEIFTARILRMRDKLLELFVAAGDNEENSRVNITKGLAVLPVNETSDLKFKPVSKKKKGAAHTIN